MALRMIRDRDLIRRPWKNGGGTTAEIAIHPAGASLETFDWRISMADVVAEGPFSPFPGLDRSLALIEGSAVDLDVDGVMHRLDAGSPVLSFTGDAATSARLPAGPIRDLNVMTRRGVFSHRMAAIGPNEGAWTGSAGILAVLALEDGTEVVANIHPYGLDRHDILIADPGPVTLLVRRGVIVVEIARSVAESAATSSPA